MATFYVSIKGIGFEDIQKELKVRTLSAAKAMATVIFNSLAVEAGHITIANEKGNDIAYKRILKSGGKWQEVAPGKEQEEVAQAADEKIEYVVAFTLRENGENCTATVKAKDLHFAKYEASCLQDAAHGKWEDNVAVLNKDGVKLADRQRIRGLLTWRDCEQVQAKEMEAEKGFSSRCVMAKVNDISFALPRIETINESEKVLVRCGTVIQLACEINAPIIDKIAHAGNIHDSWHFASVQALRSLRECANNKVSNTWCCFVTCDNGDLCYVTKKEAAALDQPYQDVKPTIAPAFMPASWGNARLMMHSFSTSGFSLYISDQYGKVADICTFETVKPEFSRNGAPAWFENVSYAITGDRFMITERAAKAIERFYDKANIRAFEIGFIQLTCGAYVVVTSGEALTLDEDFTSVMITKE